MGAVLPMKIAIIGAGFTGLAAAWKLSQQGHQITLIEAQDQPGGLASGFQTKGWNWSLEHHYHHIFASDKHIKNLVTQMDLESLMTFRTTKTDIIYQNNLHPLDSPVSLIKLNCLSPISRIRTASTLAFLKINPFWQPLEKITAQNFIKQTMGEESWKVLWQPLFIGKFGTHASRVNAAWFWARIFARTKSLGYFKGGFLNLAQRMVMKLEASGVETYFNTPVKKIKHKPQELSSSSHAYRQAGRHPSADGSHASGIYKNNFTLTTINSKLNKQQFDKVLVAAPSMVLQKITPKLPAAYVANLNQLKGIGAQTLILELDKPFFKNNTYWLNINQKNWPFLAVVEHTNFVNKKHYNNHNLVYVGKYLDSKDKQYQLNKDQLLESYHSYLDKLSPGYKSGLINSYLFKTPFAQPIPSLNHSQTVPTLTTPIPGLYWVSMQHVYPWDRGTNFAVKLGLEIAKEITNNPSF